MASKRFFPGLLIIALILGMYSFAVDDDPVDKIRQQLDKWTSERPMEKVYLHLDKPYYAAGDDIWFKAYVTHGSYNRLAADSGILNVELIDEQDSIKQHLKLALKNGTGAGDFALPDTLHQGNYRIRAYTNYMRNAGSEYFFDKAINIINAIVTNNTNPPGNARFKTPPVKPTNVQTDVQFFPESGSLVNGVPTKVAFKAVGTNGLGADVKGVITDNQGKQVAAFNSTHLGMGSFNITPAAGNIYNAKINFADGSVKTSALPKVMDKGYVLSITDTDPANLQVKIAADRVSLNAGPGGQVVLVAQSAGKIYYTGKSKPGNVVIPKSKFPAGIVQFTLFSAAGEPLNERLVFVRNTDKLVLTLAADRQSYSPRQKVKINVNAKNGENKPSAGSFSVSVTDETKVPVNEANENNILASLLLTSDLKGFVEQPAYYFINVDDKTRADMDVLMLTQGYRRFEWREILNDKFAANSYQPESSLQVTGTITNPAGKPVASSKVKLIDLDDINFSMDAVTDARGRFAFTNLVFEDSLRFIVQARTAKNKKDVVINIDSVAPPSTSVNKNRTGLEVNLSDSLTIYAQSSKQLYNAQLSAGVGNHVITLKEVIIREKKQALKYSSNLNGPGNADQVLLARDLQNLGCIRISDCLQGRLLGVIFRNGVPYSTRSYGPMLIIIDGVYVEASYLNNINYNDVQAIEVLRNIGSVGIYGGRGGNGVIIVTTKRGGENEYEGPITGRGIKVLYPKGYLKARTFYSPQYDRSGVNKQLADLRTTIFWKPDVTTGTNGNAAFEYFNAGTKGNYRVVIEGIDSEGNIGRQVYRYKVE